MFTRRLCSAGILISVESKHRRQNQRRRYRTKEDFSMKFTVDPIYLASAADTIRAAAGLRTDDLCRRYR